MKTAVALLLGIFTLVALPAKAASTLGQNTEINTTMTLWDSPSINRIYPNGPTDVPLLSPPVMLENGLVTTHSAGGLPAVILETNIATPSAVGPVTNLVALPAPEIGSSAVLMLIALLGLFAFRRKLA